MIALEIEQRSEEWNKARLGIPTASSFDKIITPQGKPSKQAMKYLYTLACERVTGVKEEGFKSSAMDRGTAMEEEARQFYEMLRDCEVKTVGFCYKDERKLFGSSPDGLVGEDGILEIKCPIASTHVAYLIGENSPEEYYPQAQGNLYITGRKWADILIYYPGVKPLIIRWERDEPFIKELETGLESFSKNLEEMVKRIAV